ncbi:hypothetical protein ACQP00_16770 [Dactylosporangium sp. CS-047395]|uniref:hypothetical protein n=1 Tax=Dactylosporangium sp. CS-047395 TaxID=3239936 RepID=UPI003D8C9B70
MTDDEVLDAVKKTLADVQMDRPIETIEQRGRTRRRNRGLLGVAAGAGLAALAAVAVAVPLLGGDPAAPTQTAPETGGAAEAPALEPAAFAVTKQADGSVELVLDYKKILNPDALQKALSDAGIPAVVKAGVLCTPQAKELPGADTVFRVKRVEEAGESRYDLIINPAKMPKDSVVYFSVFAVHKGENYAKAAQYLVTKDAAMNCRAIV